MKRKTHPFPRPMSRQRLPYGLESTSTPVCVEVACRNPFSCKALDMRKCCGVLSRRLNKANTVSMGESKGLARDTTPRKNLQALASRALSSWPNKGTMTFPRTTCKHSVNSGTAMGDSSMAAILITVYTGSSAVELPL